MKKFLLVVLAAFSLFITNVKAAESAASVAGTNYDTLEEALNAAKEGETVTLLTDVTENVTIKTAITLDLNGKTISGVGNKSTITVAITNANSASLTITNGKITNDQKMVARGAGIAINSAKDTEKNPINVLINNIEVYGTNGMNGAAIFIDSGNITITNSNFHNNKGYNGGAIYMSSTDTTTKCTIKNTKIHDNTASNGGAITLGSASAKTTATVVIEKETELYNNNVSGNGGAIYTTGHGSSAIINGGSIYNNKGANGGAIAILDNCATFTMNGGKIYNNTAKGTKRAVGLGGGVYIKANNRGKIITISDEVVIKDNNSAIGGGLYIDSYTTVNEEIVATVNAAIYNNNASKYADDIYTSGNGKLGIKLNLGKTSSWNISCKDTVDGWYLDGENNRWNAHGTTDTISINPLNELKVTESNSIKAAHNYISKVIVHHYLVGTTTKVADDEILSGKLGETFIATAKEIAKLNLVSDSNKVEGSYTINDQEIIFNYDYQSASIKAKYVEIDTDKELAKEEVINGKVNDSYKTVAKDILGYELVKVEGNEEGTLDLENPTIIYYYKAVYGKVTIKYVDEDDKELAPSETTTKQVGEKYQTEAKTFDDYELVKVEGNEEGTYSKEDIEVVYVYQFVKGQGDGEDPTVTIEDKPYTGTEESNSYTSVITMISSLTLGTYLVVSKKRFN